MHNIQSVFNSIPIILNLLTDRNIALIYSVTICEQKTNDCSRSRSFQHIKLQQDIKEERTLRAPNSRNLEKCTPLFSTLIVSLRLSQPVSSAKYDVVVTTSFPNQNSTKKIPIQFYKSDINTQIFKVANIVEDFIWISHIIALRIQPQKLEMFLRLHDILSKK